MKILFFDIETIPTKEALAEVELQDTPSETQEIDEHRIRRLSLSALTARILCIGYTIEPPRDSAIEILEGEESQILKNFWKLTQDIGLFVGHNILDFDLRFIYQRSIINQVKPAREIPFQRFRSAPVFDTMHEWSRWGREYIKLDLLARCLNIPSPKVDLDGSKVYETYRSGNLEAIYEYCKKDVETVREVYHRMTFG